MKHNVQNISNNQEFYKCIERLFKNKPFFKLLIKTFDETIIATYSKNLFFRKNITRKTHPWIGENTQEELEILRENIKDEKSLLIALNIFYEK